MSQIYKIIIISLLFPNSVVAFQFNEELVKAAIERTHFKIQYDGSYHSIDYPNGDVPGNIGVCTDVVIRAYRTTGYDLQKLVHEDMVKNFTEYPSSRIWGLKKPDKNIDHRRVPNLQVFFSKYGEILTTSSNPNDYNPGDLVTWALYKNLPHIGIVTGIINTKTGTPMIVHNIGRGPQLDDMLFSYKITGHYKYIPK